MKSNQDELPEDEPLNPSGASQVEELPPIEQQAIAISRLLRASTSRSKAKTGLSPIDEQLKKGLEKRGIRLSDEEIKRISTLV